MRRAIAIGAVLAMLLCGCDYSDPDRMAIITGAAIDYGEDGYELTIETVKTESASLDEPVETQLFSMTAPSLDLGEQALVQLCGSALYWGHAQALVLSREAARSAFRPIVDWVLRTGDLRLTVVMGVSGQEDAKAVLDGEHSGSYTVGSALASEVKDSGFAVRGAGGGAHRTVESVAQSGAALMPRFMLKQQDEDRSYAVVDGGAVMVGDTLAGFLDDRRARDLLLLLGADKNYELVRSRSGDYGLTLSELKSEPSASVDGEGEATVTFALSGKCRLVYYNGGGSADDLSEMLNDAATLLAQRVADAVEAARELKADAANMAAVLRPLVGDEFAAEAALQCKVRIDVELKLTDTGLIARSPLK